MSSLEGSERIDQALQSLKIVIQGVVREEQLRDPLTTLQNDLALTALLESAIENGQPFWVAFIEADYFKRVNEAFGYENADGLLRAIGRQLTAGYDFFSGTAKAFHAHGDEFYLLGELKAGQAGPEVISAGLEQVCHAVGTIRLRVAQFDEPMQCTVSIGWITSDEEGMLLGGVRAIRERLALAVDVAKFQGRNCVVQYQPTFSVSPLVSLRDRCTACRTSFTCDTPREKCEEGSLYCPNCGGRVPRPAVRAHPTVQIPNI